MYILISLLWIQIKHCNVLNIYKRELSVNTNLAISSILRVVQPNTAYNAIRDKTWLTWYIIQSSAVVPGQWKPRICATGNFKDLFFVQLFSSSASHIYTNSYARHSICGRSAKNARENLIVTYIVLLTIVSMTLFDANITGTCYFCAISINKITNKKYSIAKRICLNLSRLVV